MILSTSSSKLSSIQLPQPSSLWLVPVLNHFFHRFNIYSDRSHQNRSFRTSEVQNKWTWKTIIHPRPQRLHLWTAVKHRLRLKGKTKNRNISNLFSDPYLSPSKGKHCFSFLGYIEPFQAFLSSFSIRNVCLHAGLKIARKLYLLGVFQQKKKRRGKA